jgi:hypothetical protein
MIVLSTAPSNDAPWKELEQSGHGMIVIDLASANTQI